MPTTTSTPVPADLQEQLLENVRQSQKQMLEAVQSWSETTRTIVPEMPAPKLSPELNELVSGAFDFAEKLLANQREFAQALVAAAASGKTDSSSSAKASK